LRHNNNTRFCTHQKTGCSLACPRFALCQVRHLHCPRQPLAHRCPRLPQCPIDRFALLAVVHANTDDRFPNSLGKSYKIGTGFIDSSSQHRKVPSLFAPLCCQTALGGTPVLCYSSHRVCWGESPLKNRLCDECSCFSSDSSTLLLAGTLGLAGCGSLKSCPRCTPVPTWTPTPAAQAPPPV
jgi:hypothetical protein